MILCACQRSQYDGSMGSAWRIDKPSVIVSIFASDAHTKWMTSDRKVKRDCLSRLKDACNYLEKQINKYTQDCSFTNDWKKNSDLYYETSFKENHVKNNTQRFCGQKDYIEEKIPSNKLKEKYHAENIIYMFFYNTPYSNTVRSATFCDDAFYDGGKHMPEMISINYRTSTKDTGDRYITYRQGYAHEIMHCFAAPDLYYKNDYITQKYVDHMNKINAKDLMYRLSEENKWFDFTELDAYYLGLTDKCADVKKFRLRKSNFIDPGI